MPTVASSPRWDLTPFFSSISSPEFEASFSALRKEVADLETHLDVHKIAPGTGDSAFDATLTAYEALMQHFNYLGAYVGALVATNSNDAEALARESELDDLYSRFSLIDTRIVAWAGTLDIAALQARSELARGLDFWLRRVKVQATKQMSPTEEALASKLSTTGGVAWSKLHGTLTSQILVKVPLPTGEESLPMSAARNLAYDSSRSVRKNAYEAEIAAWKANEVACAACMNSIKGEVGTLAKLRNWPTALDHSLFHANIDKATLDAMLGAAKEFFPDFRRYLKAKAKLLGQPKLAWFDLFAPVGESTRNWSYDEGRAFVEKQFYGYGERMGKLATRAFEENWVDAEPRSGKRDGAFCQGYNGDVSRVLMNYKSAFGSVSTLAHELGHAYHNVCVAERSQIQRDFPMTLAETASIFCETILKRAALAEADEKESLSILEAALQGSCQVVVDITSRFLFEKSVFDGRPDREFSPKELNDLMLDAQLKTYGDGLDPDVLHPYMWAVKPHYYSSWSFYNYPYMFGLLFALGLYAIYDKEPAGFQDRYDKLLSETGMADAATLAAGFGIDTRSPEFWRGSLNVIKADIDRFEAIVS